jgi:hypothetical protein
VHELHAGRAQARQVQLGPAAAQVVERDHLVVRPRQREGQVRADEAGAASDEDPHV